jgi:amino acid transporter
MDQTTTLVIGAVAALLTAFFGWRGALPPNFAKGPRLIPYRFLMLLSAAALLMMVVHLANLYGIQTGNRQR